MTLPAVKQGGRYGVFGAGFLFDSRGFGALGVQRDGSVAQISRDSLRDSKMLVGVHEQIHTSELSYDELALLSSH